MEYDILSSESFFSWNQEVKYLLEYFKLSLCYIRDYTYNESRYVYVLFLIIVILRNCVGSGRISDVPLLRFYN